MVSVIVLSQANSRLASTCVQSALVQVARIGGEIVLLDTSATGCQHFYYGPNADRVRVFRTGSAMGASSARNYAARLCRQELFLFLDDDSVLLPNSISELLAVYKTWPHVGIVTGVIRDARDSSIVQSAGIGITTSGLNMPLNTGVRADEVVSLPPFPVQGASSGLMLVSRHDYWLVGGFDTAFDPIGYEDIDFSYRVKNAGLAIVVCPRAQQIHWGTHFVPSFDGKEDRAMLYLRNLSRFQKNWGKLFRMEAGPTHAELVKQRKAERWMSATYPRDMINPADELELICTKILSKSPVE